MLAYHSLALRAGLELDANSRLTRLAHGDYQFRTLLALKSLLATIYRSTLDWIGIWTTSRA